MEKADAPGREKDAQPSQGSRPEQDHEQAARAACAQRKLSGGQTP